ncbi:uncharacterized protein V1518DRAFT_434651 [Limtongia smithiae]|uniref:uncharacterized protein n=1 Tax=Limtongia smithiae TaxID=1125753 RepID=UPI0034CE21A5
MPAFFSRKKQVSASRTAAIEKFGESAFAFDEDDTISTEESSTLDSDAWMMAYADSVASYPTSRALYDVKARSVLDSYSPPGAADVGVRVKRDTHHPQPPSSLMSMRRFSSFGNTIVQHAPRVFVPPMSHSNGSRSSLSAPTSPSASTANFFHAHAQKMQHNDTSGSVQPSSSCSAHTTESAQVDRRLDTLTLEDARHVPSSAADRQRRHQGHPRLLRYPTAPTAANDNFDAILLPHNLAPPPQQHYISHKQRQRAARHTQSSLQLDSNATPSSSRYAPGALGASSAAAHRATHVPRTTSTLRVAASVPSFVIGDNGSMTDLRNSLSETPSSRNHSTDADIAAAESSSSENRSHERSSRSASITSSSSSYLEATEYAAANRSSASIAAATTRTKRAPSYAPSLSPESSMIFERQVQDQLLSPDAVPSHHYNANMIPPVLAASCEILTDSAANFDRVEVISITRSSRANSMHKSNSSVSLASLQVSSPSISPMLSPHAPSLPPIDTQHRLSFCSYSDVVQYSLERDGVGTPGDDAETLNGYGDGSPSVMQSSPPQLTVTTLGDTIRRTQYEMAGSRQSSDYASN